MRYLELNSALLQRENGFFPLERDREAVREFAREVAAKRRPFPSVLERLATLIEEGYYENFFARYTPEFLQEIHERALRYPFEFESFMAISKFYKDYALQTGDKGQYLEDYAERVVAVALHLAQGDEAQARAYALAMMERRYQPATPTFLNAGRARRGELVSCFLLEVDDSLNSIGYNLNAAMQLSKIGGGVALNLSRLRARGEPIKGVEGAAKGVVPVMKLLEDAFNYADQMGQRKGAGAVYLNIFHWDLEEVLDTKKINADEKSRIQTLALGLVVPDKFFQLAAQGKPFYVFAPYSVYRAFGVPLDEMDLDTRYEELLAHPEVKKRPLDAREILIRIARLQFESGYPYLIYRGAANRANPLKGLGQIKMSNLCTEIFQIQSPSVVGPYGTPEVVGYDVSCNLGSLNIVNVMERRALRESVRTATDALTAVSDQSEVAQVPGVARANRELHAIGLGAMNLHGYLAKNEIPYESAEAREFARAFFMAVNYYSLERSMEIARARGQTFRGFEGSDYASGAYFAKYLERDWRPNRESVKALFAGMPLPGPKEWTRLAALVQEHGLYHAYRLAIAPTQSISYLQNATPSVAPITDLVETRTYGNATTYYPVPYLSPKTLWYYKSAYHMDMYRVIDLVAEIQEHVDQGVSTVLFVNSQTSTRELARLYIYAWNKGLKSLYYTRTKNLTLEECVACAV